MNWFTRAVRWLSGDLTPEEAPVPPAEPASRSVAAAARGADPINDAQDYGVTVESITPQPGAAHWRVRKVHHLTPAENQGRHHIYIDAVDEAGKRLFNSQAQVTWSDGSAVATIDKPLHEPGANLPLFKGQVCSVEMVGGASDKVHGLSSSHPDEPNPDGSQSGNTLFHHSFLVEFQRTQAAEQAEPAPAQGVIQGRVEGGGGLILQLYQGETLVAKGTLGPSGAFRLRSLARGIYEIRILGEENAQPVVASGPVHVTGPEPVIVNLTTVPAPQPQPEPQPQPQPQPEPQPESLFDQFVLFGPPDQANTRIHLLLLGQTLAAQTIPFGFRAEEAAHARQVIIIGGEEGVSAQTAGELAAQGVSVRRVAGDAQTIQNALAARSHP